MRNSIMVGFVLAVSLVLGACQTVPSKVVVKSGAELATVVALQHMDANEKEAIAVREIAVVVDGVLGEGGDLDPAQLKQYVMSLIVNEFGDDADRILLVSLVSAISEILLAELDGVSITPGQTKVVLLAQAAAQGVVSGADIYIIGLKPENAPQLGPSRVTPVEVTDPGDGSVTNA